MTVSVSLLATAAVLCAVGGILMLTRPLTRILLGAVIAGNGINLLVLAAGAGPARNHSCTASRWDGSPTRCRRRSPSPRSSSPSPPPRSSSPWPTAATS